MINIFKLNVIEKCYTKVRYNIENKTLAKLSEEKYIKDKTIYKTFYHLYHNINITFKWIWTIIKYNSMPTIVFHEKIPLWNKIITFS